MIDIQTSQNVSISYETASVGERLVAFFADLLLFALAYTSLIYVLLTAAPGVAESGLMAYFLFGLLPVTGLMAYHFLFEALWNGQTPGKRFQKLKVVRLDGEEASLGDYLLRAILYAIDIVLSLGILAILLIASSSRGQRIGDMAANTTVIRLNPRHRFPLAEILNIGTTKDYEATYPQVQQLGEPDMLLIKAALNRYRDLPNIAHWRAIVELTQHLSTILELDIDPQANKVEFLKTLLRDYIVLTR